MDNRSEKEQVIDKLLLLFVLKNHEIGATKLQKTVFFVEDSLNNQKIKSFNYNFFRWKHGEFSRQLETDMDSLIDNGFLFATDGSIKTTDMAEQILKKTIIVFQNNAKILRMVDSIGEFSEKHSLSEVLKVAYTRIFRNNTPVGDIPEGFNLLDKIEENEAKSKFEIDDGVIETLNIMFDKKTFERIKKAIDMPADIPLET